MTIKRGDTNQNSSRVSDPSSVTIIMIDIMIVTLFLALLTSFAAARPLSAGNALASRELTDTLTKITIHESCNVTERRQLSKALQETYELASVARDYVLQHGHTDQLFKTYFGTGEPYPVIGAYEQLISGDKTGVLLRCDNIDGNCDQEGWYGHWRGENATLETVICQRSYEGRKPLEQFCALGYTVAEYSPSYYFATDLMHRFYHIPAIGNEIIEHYADSYEDCLQLAIDYPTNATYNTHSLQYFAADVYARVVGNPGEGCTGTVTSSNTTTSSAPVASTSATNQPASTSASATSSAAQHCHTHADGEVHCV
ncbi:Prenylated Rab acceptor protein 1 [Paramarasmius palmivorus]|uniref:Prenylated Rab acceptor protein 1 n=1 Tax=Paramarasmius palmivorus TaxID=297713 RepID=A0AAW0DPP2_9AGAR